MSVRGKKIWIPVQISTTFLFPDRILWQQHKQQIRIVTLFGKMRASMGHSSCQEGLDSHKHLLNEEEEKWGSRITYVQYRHTRVCVHTRAHTERVHCNWRFLSINSNANGLVIWDLRALRRRQRFFQYSSLWQWLLTLSPEIYFMFPLTQKVRNADVPQKNLWWVADSF